jgi:hypothetical protein
MKWIYRYLDAAMNETDMGFYETELEAQIASDEHDSYGAIKSRAIEVPDDYELFKPNYDNA